MMGLTPKPEATGSIVGLLPRNALSPLTPALSATLTLGLFQGCPGTVCKGLGLRLLPMAVLPFPSMNAKHVTPILNVSDIAASFRMVREVGLEEVLGLGIASDFRVGRVGRMRDLSLPRGSRSRGKGANTATFGPSGDETVDRGV
jgi:hypothetical protein